MKINLMPNPAWSCFVHILWKRFQQDRRNVTYFVKIKYNQLCEYKTCPTVSLKVSFSCILWQSSTIVLIYPLKGTCTLVSSIMNLNIWSISNRSNTQTQTKTERHNVQYIIKIRQKERTKAFTQTHKPSRFEERLPSNQHTHKGSQDNCFGFISGKRSILLTTTKWTKLSWMRVDFFTTTSYDCKCTPQESTNEKEYIARKTLLLKPKKKTMRL